MEERKGSERRTGPEGNNGNLREGGDETRGEGDGCGPAAIIAPPPPIPECTCVSALSLSYLGLACLLPAPPPGVVLWRAGASVGGRDGRRPSEPEARLLHESVTGPRRKWATKDSFLP